MKLQKGMRVLLVNSNHIAFVYGVFQRKTDWDSAHQSLLVNVEYVHNPIDVHLHGSKVRVSGFNRYAVDPHGNGPNWNMQHCVAQATEISRHIKQAALSGRHRDRVLLELKLLEALETIPEYTYIK